MNQAWTLCSTFEHSSQCVAFNLVLFGVMLPVWHAELVIRYNVIG